MISQSLMYATPERTTALSRKHPVYHAVKRSQSVCRARLRYLNDIAHTTDRLDKLGGIVPLYLVTDATYQDIHHVSLRIKTIIPNMFKQHRFGDDTPRIPHQIFEEGKLP